MPKESKKFINPLLRPSQQEVEPKQEPPRQEKSMPAARVQADRIADQEVEQEERGRPAPSAPPVAPMNDIPVLTTTERVRLPDTERSRLHDPERVRPPDSQPVSKEPTRTKVTRTGAYTADAQATNWQESDAGEEASAQTYEPRPETIRARPSLTSPRPEPYSARSSTATITEAVAEPQARTVVEDFTEASEEEEGEDSDAFYEGEEEPETDFTVSSRKIKRRRGEQAFEKTHVRLTVWVDKTLRQSFEDLAIQREQPKTVLLNEAIADLVRKYGVH